VFTVNHIFLLLQKMNFSEQKDIKTILILKSCAIDGKTTFGGRDGLGHTE